MTELRSELQTVAGLHGLILAWETDEAPLQACYDYAVRADQAPVRDGLVHLRARISSSREADALLGLSAFVGIRAVLNGDTVAPLEGSLEPYGNCWPVHLREGANDLELAIDLERVNPRVSARLTAPDGSPLDCVTDLSPAWEAAPEELRTDLPAGHNLSLWHYYNDLAALPPTMGLADDTRGGWLGWRATFGERLRCLLGPIDPTVPADPVPVSAEDVGDYRRERLLLRTEENMSVPVWLLTPASPNGAGIVAIHGHGYKYGETLGLYGGDAQAEQSIERHNYQYAARYAELGYTVINPDLRNFGARHDEETYRRDSCDLSGLRLQQFGINLVAQQLRDLRACLDYLGRLDGVDPDRIGATGLSYGGRLTMYLAALDQRVRCAVASGALNLFRERLTIDSSCGAQFVAGLLACADTPEVYGLIAPRPLLLELGTGDGTSPELFAMEAWARIERIYRAAEAEERLDIDIFEAGHRYSGAKAFDWFHRWLLEA